MREIKTEYGSIFEPDDVFVGEEHHPQCCFFELFPSTPDPYETFYGLMHCYLNDSSDRDCDICKGDYLKCPHAWGLIPEKKD